MALKEKSLQLDGRLTHYWEAGEGHSQSIVLLHGGFGDAWLNWGSLLPVFAADYHVFAPDLPGFGQSDALPTMTVAALHSWCKAFISAVGVEQAALVGHSFGGLIARLVAANFPKEVPALVMVDGGVIPGVAPVARIIAGLPVLGSLLFQRVAVSSSSRSSLESIVANKAVLTDAVMQGVKANVSGLCGLMRALTVGTLQQNRTPRIPVLILWGDQDGFAPVSTAETIQSNIPGAMVSVIAECGHMPHLEAPEVFTFQITNFLNDLNRARRA